MQSITLGITQIAKPQGVTAGNWQIALKNAAGAITHDYRGPVPQTVFQDVPNGEYTIIAARLSTAGELIGSNVQRAFTVTDAELIDVPVSILVGGA